MRKGWLVACLLGASALSAGCFKGQFTNCAISCDNDADCPGGLQCSPQGFCSNGGAACSTVPEIDADLTMPQRLTVTTTGDGMVTSDPMGITCGATCSADFDPLSTVMLTATPGANGVFDGWTGDCSGDTSPCALTMDNAKTVGASFLTHGARRWHAQLGLTGDDFIEELEVDANGDVVAAGQVSDAGLSSMFVVKYARADGAIVWMRKLDTPSGAMFVGGLDTDAAGNVYVCARNQGSGPLTFDGHTVTGDVFGNIAVFRFAAATGTIDWAKSWGGTAQEICGGLAVNGAAVFVTGTSSSDPSTFDGQTITGNGVSSGFLVRAATATGTAVQAKGLVGSFDIDDIAVNGAAVAVVGGLRSSPGAINTCNLTISGTGSEALIMNFNGADLNCAWARVTGSFTNGEAARTQGVAAVPGGGWVMTGYYQGTVNFAGSGASLTNLGGFDAFLVRWDQNGTHQYQFGYGTTSSEIGRGVDVLPTGEVVWGGEFGATITLGSFPLTGTGDVFVTRMSAGLTPIHQWAAKYGGTATENMTGLSVDAQGNPSVLASWSGMSDIAGTPLTAQGRDAWVASFVR
ncbi:MAG: InlB B-repeat-containing protein [Kofleriaceae bacterium]